MSRFKLYIEYEGTCQRLAIIRITQELILKLARLFSNLANKFGQKNMDQTIEVTAVLREIIKSSIWKY